MSGTTSPSLRRAATGLMLGGFMATLSAPALAGETNQTDGIALSGYDAVGYFSDGEAVPGKPEISYTHGGATYRFASVANRDAFAAAPAKYAPQYGGWCAYGLSRGYKAPVDPAAFTIRDGKLYLNYSLGIQSEWRKDTDGYVAKADRNWPSVKTQ